MDIIFYDFEFNKIFILPPSSKNIGYTSMNATKEFNGDGKFELVFFDMDLVKTIKEHPEGIFIVWDDFYGFVTDWQFGKEYRIFGISLNGILHKTVIPPTPLITENCAKLAQSTRKKYFSDILGWSNISSSKHNTVTFETTEYKYGNEYIQSILELDSSGYEVVIDFENKYLVLNIYPSKENPIMLSLGNLNIYDLQEDFNNKTVAYGGYYQKESEESEEEGQWLYITIDDTKTGFYKQDIILKAKTEDEARNELKEYAIEHKLTGKTKNIKYGIDYKLGDKVRVMQDDYAVWKKVTAISKWYEGSTINEEPTLSEIKEG